MRRRRRRGTWFPTIGTDVGGLATVNGRAFALTLATDTISTAVTAVTFDTPFEGDSITPGIDSLADIVGSEYTLQRIVGSVFATRVASLNLGLVDAEAAVLFGAGFFVARAGDASSGAGTSQPIGSGSANELRDNYSPLETDTVREPWIWRRTWILGAAGQNLVNSTGTGVALAASGTTASFPASTSLYGSVADGPKLDSRVKRVVSQDNRLWFAVSATPFPFNTPVNEGETLIINGYLDLRIYATLRRARNTSAF